MAITAFSTAKSYYNNHQEELFQEFLQLLRIPSVSTLNDHKNDIQAAADFLVGKLKAIGFENVSAYSTKRHPSVYGEHLSQPEGPTVLLYGHYDVQPPDPLAEWETAPFDPQIRGDYLYARGASDMKGQIWALISAIQSIMKVGSAPINIKFLIEGEEEIGSPSLDDFLVQHKSLLNCDFVLNIDAGMIAPDKPTIVYALRGLAYFELRLFGPSADLHSGIFGGVVDNPANILSKIIGNMHDDENHITLPGFYGDVREISAEESQSLSQLGMNEEFYKNITGVRALGGETDFSPIERAGARPTLDVNGLYSGYTEKGAKTIIPSFAMAKLSMRLVPDQKPEAIHKSLETYLQENLPESTRYELDYLSGAPAYINENEVPGLEQFSRALENTWGVKPFMKREGGSIPVATAMKEILGVDSIISGFGLPDDKIHSPNERLHLPTHEKGIEALIHFFLNFE